MTNKLLKPLAGSLHKDLTILDGYVAIDADGYVVSSTSILGMVVSHAGNETGQYTFTLSDPRGTVKFAAATFVAGTAVDLVAQVVSFTASTVVVKLCAGATATTPTAACGLLVSIHYKRSTARAAG